MVKVIIHAGMPKTGSSSIQDYFHQYRSDSTTYARWAGSNHCGLFILLFQQEELLKDYHGFKARRSDFIASLPELKAKRLKILEEDMNSSVGKTLIFSAEDISVSIYRGAVERMHTFFNKWTDDITVIAYARSPLSFALSAFQERLKIGGMNSLNVSALWPGYRARFSPFDDIFGVENVILRYYDRKSLHNGDVVADFASIIGARIENTQIPQSNTSLSAEATALLFLQRRLGEGYLSGFAGAQAGNNLFIRKLQDIGKSRLMFSDTLWLPVLQKNLEDLKWMEARLGQDMSTEITGNEIMINSEEDLLQLAVQSYGALEAALIGSIRHSARPPRERTARALDLLRKDSY